MHAVPDLRFVVWFAVVAPPAFQTSMCLTNAQHLHNERGARSCCHTVGRALQHHSIVLLGVVLETARVRSVASFWDACSTR